MIRQETLTSVLRFYESDSEDPFEPFVAVATLVWENPTTVWIKGLLGTLGRKQIRELTKVMHDQGVHTLKAYRDQAHRIPFGREVGDHLEISVADAVARYSP